MLQPPSALTPPSAPRRPARTAVHGDAWLDDYFWLRERDNPDVIAYLQAENDYTAAAMAHTAELQETLFQEMVARVKQTDESAPLPEGDYWYCERTEEGKSYPFLVRRRQTPAGQQPAPAEVLLDVNALAAGHEFCHLGGWRISPDQRLLAYALDVGGNELFDLCVKDLATGELLADCIPATYYGFEWSADGQYLFYTTVDHAHRPDRVHRHRLGTPASEDVEILHEADERFNVEVSKTRSGRFLLIEVGSNTTSEWRYIDAAEPTAAPRVIDSRRQDREYSVDHWGERFIIRTNDMAQNFRIVTAPVVTPDAAHWRELVPNDPQRLISGLAAFAQHLALLGYEEGLPTLHILRLAAGEGGAPVIAAQHKVTFPEPVYTYRLLRNAVFDTQVIYFVYTSLTTPATAYAYDMDARTFNLVKRDEIAGYNPDDYVTLRLWATAEDGARIPMSVVHRKGIERNGDNPAWLYGYGSYGATVTAAFDANRISLLERGFVFALAHIRGGSEMGRAWYENGKLLHKRNTFTDFIACAEHLQALGYTRPAKLVISGRSAGGLLMGVVTNLRPDLFAGVIAGVPFMDVINTMLDPTIPLTVTEYEEWGNPNNEEHYRYMLSYSPYNQLEAKAYPNLLVTAGLHDPRVSYWEPAKYVARLRALKTDANLLLLKTNMAAGHGGATGRYDHLREVAFEYAFFLEALDE